MIAASGSVTAKKPWTKWFWADWRSDVELRSCGLSARGLWAELLGLMEESAVPGFLLIKGRMPAAKTLVGHVGASGKDIAQGMAELLEAGVPSVTGDAGLPDELKALIPADMPGGVWFSRRIVRDCAKAARDRANGKLGGNRVLLDGDKVGVNPLRKGEDKPHGARRRRKRTKEDNPAVNEVDMAQKPETRKNSPLEPPRARAAPEPSGHGQSKTRGRETDGADHRKPGKVWYDEELARLRGEFGEDANVVQANCGGPVAFVKAFKDARFDRAGLCIVARDGRHLVRLRAHQRLLDASFGEGVRIVIGS